MRRLRTAWTASNLICGHAFVQKLHCRHYELGVDASGKRRRLAAVFGELAQAISEKPDTDWAQHAPRSANATVPITQRFGAALHRHIRGRISDALAYAVENYRAEVGDIISSTVAKWDGASTADKLELQVGRDLQFIRINGTIVGGLAGLAIHAVGQFL